MENQKFEGSFREAFMGAEIVPSNSVWISIELGLEKTSGGKMKGRILFLQLLAAASMIFAMGVGGIYYLQTPQSNDAHLATKQNIITTPDHVENNPDKTSSQQINELNRSTDKTIFVNQRSSSPVLINSAVPTVDENLITETESSEYSTWGKQRQLPGLVEVKQPKLILSRVEEPDPGMVLLARLKDEEQKYQTRKKKVKENLWTSIGVGMGSYNPNTSSLASMQSFATSYKSSSRSTQSFVSPLSASNPTSGNSYSATVSVASKVGSRVIIQGGVTYLSQNAEFTSSTTASGGQASLNEYMNISEMSKDGGQLLVTSPYKVNSNLQYVGMPIQAGYILIDRAFALQLNGGISTDLFLQNTLTPENENFEKVTQGSGSDSPYRPVNFSGLVGTELSYKVGDHYRVAVNPEVRYALNSIYKNDVGTDISPVTFDLALRFRYIFN